MIPQMLYVAVALATAALQPPSSGLVRSWDLTPSKPQQREQQFAGIGNSHTTFKDEFIDYTRADQLVLRSVKRTQSTGGPERPDFPYATRHFLEFIARDKVFLTVQIDDLTHANWNLATAESVSFSTGASGLNGAHHYVRVCLPGADYYENLEIRGTSVYPLHEEEYDQAKRSAIRLGAKGFLHRADEVR